MANWPWSLGRDEVFQEEKKPENLIELFDKWDREQFWGITSGLYASITGNIYGSTSTTITSAQINNHSNSIGAIIHYQGQAPTITTHCPHCKKTI